MGIDWYQKNIDGNNSSSSQDGGLSKGQIIGIIIGVIAAIILITVIFYLVKKRRLEKLAK